MTEETEAKIDYGDASCSKYGDGVASTSSVISSAINKRKFTFRFFF